jgi:SAM-dependent methyltransferase
MDRTGKPPEYSNIPISSTAEYGFNGAARTLGDICGKRVLDYGCGGGRSTLFLKGLGADASGADIREDIINLARGLSPGTEYRTIRDGKIPYPDNTFDIAFSSFVHVEMESLGEMEQAAREVHRVLKPGGIYVILTVNPEAWGHEYEYFSSRFPPGFRHESGQKIRVTIRHESRTIEFLDHYWKEGDYRATLEGGGFRVEGAERVSAERDPPPFLIVKAVKG